MGALVAVDAYGFVCAYCVGLISHDLDDVFDGDKLVVNVGRLGRRPAEQARASKDQVLSLIILAHHSRCRSGVESVQSLLPPVSP